MTQAPLPGNEPKPNEFGELATEDKSARKSQRDPSSKRKAGESKLATQNQRSRKKRA